MAVFKCKICGGTLEINVGETVATCEYCGTKQTLPKLDDEKKTNPFDKANHFSRNSHFYKASENTEPITNHQYARANEKTKIPILLERAFIHLESKEWLKAEHLFEEILKIDMHIPDAYIGKCMVTLHVTDKRELAKKGKALLQNINFKLALRFADELQKQNLQNVIDETESYIKKKKERCKQARKISVISLICIFFSLMPILLVFNYYNSIVAISAGYYHTVGLKKNGTAVAVGDNRDGQCDVEDWKDIIAISAGNSHTVGLKKDGTVVAVGDNDGNNLFREEGACDVNDWQDIVAISAGDYYTVGLKKDGTVVAVGDNAFGQCNFNDWTNIITISTDSTHTVGLKKNGTTIAIGYNGNGQCDTEGWQDIIAISAGNSHTVGLKKDGSVTAVGIKENGALDNVNFGHCDVNDWKDIIAISAGNSHTVGLKKDGTVVAVGDDKYGQCDVGGW